MLRNPALYCTNFTFQTLFLFAQYIKNFTRLFVANKMLMFSIIRQYRRNDVTRKYVCAVLNLYFLYRGPG